MRASPVWAGWVVMLLSAAAGPSQAQTHATPPVPLAASDAPPGPSAPPGRSDLPDGAWQWQIDSGVGGQWQSSPLVRLSPQGTLIRLPGQVQTGGTQALLSAQAMGEVLAGPPCSLSVAADASAQRSLSGFRALDLSMASLRPAMHCATGLGSLGLALQAQQMRLAAEPFRRVAGLQVDWTVAQGEDHSTLLLDLARWRHPGELSDLDARATTLLLQRHQTLQMDRLSADVTAFLSRESNRHHFDEFSQRSFTLQAALQGRHDGGGWSLGAMAQHAVFDGSAFAEVARRRDRAVGLDAALWFKLDEHWDGRLDVGWMRSRSNTPLYDGQQRRFALSLQWSR